jgi:hypothetical protein
MKARAFLSLLPTAAVFLATAFVLVGCQDLNADDVTITELLTTTGVSQTTTSGLAVHTDTSTQAPASTPATSGKTPPTVAKATTTTAKLVGQLQTQLTLELALPATHYEDTDPLMKWTGAWTLSSYSKASGGTYHLTQVMGASVLIKFKGTSISLVVFKQPEMGIAKVTLDGTVYLVDLYSPDYQSKTVWTSPTLAYGTHQLRVEESGNKNPAASWPFITVDAVDVQGTLVP